MGYGMNKTIPGLYVGNFRDSKDVEQLTKYNITHILSIHDNAKKLLEDKEYLCIKASDTPDQQLLQFFPECIDFIHKARLSGGNVLVHCLAGVSRSVTVTAAYIMTVTSLGWRDSINAIRGARSCANPNFGFQIQLQKYENETLQQERKRLKEAFATSPHNDEEEGRHLMRAYHKFLMHGDEEKDDGLYPLPYRAYRSLSPDGVLLHIELDPALDDVNRKWLLGRVATWKVISSSDSSSNTMRVRYRVVRMDLQIADCDTTELEDVLKTIRFDKSNKKRPRWVKIPDRFQDHWPTQIQRFLQRAFLEGFTNALGRNFVHSLLLKYLQGEGGNEPDVWNIGGGAIPSAQMHTIYMTFSEKYESSAENSPEKFNMTLRPKAPTSIVEDSCSSHSSDELHALLSHTPVVDNMVYNPNERRAMLIVSSKRGSNFSSKDIEQLHHEMLSMLPLDGSKGRVGGILICQSLAEFRIAIKHDEEIELALVADFDFESPDICQNFHAFVGYLISFNNHCK